MLINILWVGVKRIGPDSFQWCTATGQGAMGTNWSTGSSIWKWGRISSLWGWQEQVAQGDIGFSFSGDVQNPSGHSPVQPAVADPPSAGVWTRRPTEVPSNPEHSVILCNGKISVPGIALRSVERVINKSADKRPSVRQHMLQDFRELWPTTER